MPVNASTYYGTDGELSVSGATPFDEAVFTEYFGEGGVVGRLLDVRLRVTTDVRPFHEVGSRAAKELRAGNVNIGGTIERAQINGAMLRLMLGQMAEDTEAATSQIPTFNMVLSLDNQRHAEGEGIGKLTVYGVVFDSWQTHVPEDDFVLERLGFQALRIRSEDTQVSAG